MGSIDRYIFRTTLASFALVLISLTGVIWITQALRGIDLMTSQGQTIITFLGITSLVIPALVLIIAPIALMIAISHTLNKLATDSEIIVMNAAGFSPFRLFRPFFYATCVVAFIVTFIGAYLAPDGLRRIKQWDAEITADVLTNILQPGRFAQLDQNLTIRIRERLPGGVLAGIFVDDRRDPKERVTIIADRGTVLKNENGSYLVLEDGNLERFEAGKRDPALVAFGRYAFDMSKFSNRGQDFTLGIRERYLWELLSPSPDDSTYQQLSGQFRAELHDRFMSPIYPFAFAVLTFAFLGSPRTTRQSRNFSIGGSILAVFGLRMAGFACSVMAVKTPIAVLAQYSMLIAAIAVGPVDDSRRRGGRAPRRPDGSHQQIECAARSALSGGLPQHEHGHQHAWAIFCRPLSGFGGRRICEHFRAARAGRLHRNGAQDVGAGFRLRHHGRGDLAVPRAAAARKDDAVLRTDRRDDLLPRAVSAARTGRSARRRRLGLAIHRAGAGKRDPARRCWPRPPTIRCPRTCANSPSGWKRSCSAPRRAAASRTPPASGSTRSTAKARPSSMPRAASSRASGSPA